MEDDPEMIHIAFIKEITSDPMKMYIKLSERLRKDGISAEFPEFAPVIHYLKKEINSNKINEACKENPTLKIIRRNANLALWHVSQSEAWYPYNACLRAMFLTQQCFDTYQRITDIKLNENVPFYHEFRYMYYFDYMINQAPDLVLIPTYTNISASTLILIRGPPIFFVGISTTPIHVDEYIQTSAEFFIHDINHGRRQYQNGIEYHKKHFSHLSLNEFYKKQTDFLKEKIYPMINLKDTTHRLLVKGMRQVIKIILFEILHEDAQPAFPEIICRDIVKLPGHGDAGFQVIYKNPKTGLPNIRKIMDPGGGILAFVKYKLRYGFLEIELNPQIALKEWRTTEKIADSAIYLLTELQCADIPDKSFLMELADDMTGQNPPQHKNLLGDNINVSKFTGKRPTPLPDNFFEEFYNNGVPWSGLKKTEVALEKRNTTYNSSMENAETAKVFTAGKRKTYKKRKTNKINL